MSLPCVVMGVVRCCISFHETIARQSVPRDMMSRRTGNETRYIVDSDVYVSFPVVDCPPFSMRFAPTLRLNCVSDTLCL